VTGRETDGAAEYQAGPAVKQDRSAHPFLRSRPVQLDLPPHLFNKISFKTDKS
jgi:hypothetical protein